MTFEINDAKKNFLLALLALLWPFLCEHTNHAIDLKSSFSGKVRILHGPINEKQYFIHVFHGFFHRFVLDFFHKSQKQAYFNPKYLFLYHTCDFFVACYEREIGLSFLKNPKLKLIR